MQDFDKLDEENKLCGQEEKYIGYRAREGWQLSEGEREHLLPQKGAGFRLTVCKLVVFICIGIFLYCDILASDETVRKIYHFAALYGPAVVHEQEYYRLLSYMFLHMGVNHLANNMILIFFLGEELEKIFGKWRFFFVYFSSGIIAGIVSIVYNIVRGNSVSSIGASGAGFGLIGAMICLLLTDKRQRGTAVVKRVILFTAISLYAGFSEQGIDNAAHVGGLVAGAVVTALLVLIRRRSDES